MRFNPDNGEEQFFGFLLGILESDEPHGSLAHEPDTFDLEDARPGRSAPACTPDVRFAIGHIRRERLAKQLGLPADAVPAVIYLELSSADRFQCMVQLPERVRRKNRLLSQSGQAYVSPERYFQYKQQRLEAARRRHGVSIVLLRWADQQDVMADPAILETLVTAELALRLTIAAA